MFAKSLLPCDVFVKVRPLKYALTYHIRDLICHNEISNTFIKSLPISYSL